MKTKVLSPLLLLALGIFIGGALIRCTTQVGVGNDESDFDASKYYTKTEVDTLISNARSSIIMGRTNAGAGATVYSMFHIESNEVNASISIPANGVLKNLYGHSTSITGKLGL